MKDTSSLWIVVLASLLLGCVLVPRHPTSRDDYVFVGQAVNNNERGFRSALGKCEYAFRKMRSNVYLCMRDRGWIPKEVARSEGNESGDPKARAAAVRLEELERGDAPPAADPAAESAAAEVGRGEQLRRWEDAERRREELQREWKEESP